MDGGSQGLAAWDLTVGLLEICTHPQQLRRPLQLLTQRDSQSSSLSNSRPPSLTKMEQTRGGEVLPLFCHRFTQHHPPPTGACRKPLYFSSHLFGPQPFSYQSSSPSHNQNLPRVDARALNLSFPQRLATGLEIKLQMVRESSACPTPSWSLRGPRPACPQSRTLQEAVPRNSGRAALMIRGQAGPVAWNHGLNGYSMLNLQRPSMPSSQTWKLRRGGSKSGVKLRSSYSMMFLLLPPASQIAGKPGQSGKGWEREPLGSLRLRPGAWGRCGCRRHMRYPTTLRTTLEN